MIQSMLWSALWLPFSCSATPKNKSLATYTQQVTSVCSWLILILILIRSITLPKPPHNYMCTVPVCSPLPISTPSFPLSLVACSLVLVCLACFLFFLHDLLASLFICLPQLDFKFNPNADAHKPYFLLWGSTLSKMSMRLSNRAWCMLQREN